MALARELEWLVASDLNSIEGTSRICPVLMHGIRADTHEQKERRDREMDKAFAICCYAGITMSQKCASVDIHRPLQPPFNRSWT